MIRLSKWKRMLQKLGVPDQPRAERGSATGLAAQYGLNSTFTSAAIKNISTSGIYLVTENRLRTNELITLILHEEGKPENSSELQFSVHARVARQGEEGIGLSFVLPPGLDTNLWGVLVRNIVTLTEPDQIADMFRTLRTILFLCRLCQSGAEEAILLFGGQFDKEHVETLVKIALAAENKLASEPDFDRRRAHPKLVANILREGSWSSDEPIIQLWAGLLVSSCSVDEPDDSNQVFVNLLTHIGPDLVRIFIYACEQALTSAQGAENSPSSSVVVTAEELIALTSVSDVARNATSVAYLFNLGLVQKLPDFTTYHPFEKFDIAPTRMGLELYKHCHGDRGKVDEQLVLTAEEHLRDILPQPTAMTSE
jgi:hypothetical protein